MVVVHVRWCTACTYRLSTNQLMYHAEPIVLRKIDVKDVQPRAGSRSYEYHMEVRVAVLSQYCCMVPYRPTWRSRGFSVLYVIILMFY